MRTLTVDDCEAKSSDFVKGNRERLKGLFPEAFRDGGVDFEVLRELLGEIEREGEEKYGLNWHGKRRARQLALTPSTGTLLPRPDESLAWETSQNLMIEGDNLEVLKLLQKSYAGKVKLICIDPPYNTGKDFVYRDNFQDSIKNYLELTRQVQAGKKIGSNTEASGRYHTAWLNMMYPRLKLARNLLKPDGVIFITIDDHEMSGLKAICDEIYGEENHLGTLVWQHSLQPKGYSGTFSVHHNFVLCYRKSEEFELANLPRTDEHNKNYNNPDYDPNGPWRPGDVRNALYRPNLIYKISTPCGKTIDPPANGWRWSRETLESKISTGEIIFSQDETRIIRKIYLRNVEGRTPETILFGKDVGTTRDAAREIKELFDGELPFDTPKPTALIRHFIALAGARADDIVMDFFAGSGTTGQAVLDQNAADGERRRYILVQLPEPLDPKSRNQKGAAEYCMKLGKPLTIAELTKERLRRASAKIRNDNPTFGGDVGFRVLALAPGNLRTWELEPESLQEDLVDAVAQIKAGRSESDITAPVDVTYDSSSSYSLLTKQL